MTIRRVAVSMSRTPFGARVSKSGCFPFLSELNTKLHSLSARNSDGIDVESTYSGPSRETTWRKAFHARALALGRWRPKVRQGRAFGALSDARVGGLSHAAHAAINRREHVNNHAPLNPVYVEHMTQSQVAAYLNKSQAWCERKRWDGTGPAYIKVGRSVYYFKADIDAWLVAQRRTQSNDMEKK